MDVAAVAACAVWATAALYGRVCGLWRGWRPQKFARGTHIRKDAAPADSRPALTAAVDRARTSTRLAGAPHPLTAGRATQHKSVRHVRLSVRRRRRPLLVQRLQFVEQHGRDFCPWCVNILHQSSHLEFNFVPHGFLLFHLHFLLLFRLGRQPGGVGGVGGRDRARCLPAVPPGAAGDRGGGGTAGGGTAARAGANGTAGACPLQTQECCALMSTLCFTAAVACMCAVGICLIDCIQ